MQFGVEQRLIYYVLLLLVDVIRDKETGRSRGFGFVKYDNVEDAKDALDAMNGKVWYYEFIDSRIYLFIFLILSNVFFFFLHPDP